MENKIFKPRKRQNLTELSNKVYTLTSAIRMKLELEKQIDYQSKLIIAMNRSSLWSSLLWVFAFRFWIQRNLKKKIEISRLSTDLGVKEKQKNIYHRNELLLEQEFEDVYDEMNERFIYYLEFLNKLGNKDFSLLANQKNLDLLPMDDVFVLNTKYTNDPPATKTEKLSFYLSMEALLYRCQNS